MTIFLWFSCAGSPAGVPDAEFPPAESSQAAAPDNTSGTETWTPAEYDPLLFREMAFLPALFPSLEVPPGVGQITGDRRDRAASLSGKEKDALSESYRTAYIDGLFRGFPLSGVLGGDLVHGWPDNNPSGWVQNWSTSAPQINSWGLPPLVLAIRGLRAEREMPGGRVFVVQGRILDQYGRSAGINRANGDMGYGSPRGYEFLSEGKVAQRFDLGLITVDSEGKGAFIPGEPPSLEFDPPSDLGLFAGASSEDIRAAFITAWKMALDRGIESMTSDGPGQYLSFTASSWDFPGGETLEGLFIQSFNRRTILLVLANSPLLPPYPRFISSPFLEVLLSASRHSVPGGENLKPLDIKFSGGDGFARSLMRGLALYGIPLTDPVPVIEAARAESGSETGEEGEAAIHRELQRFSRGWLSGPAATKP